MKNAIQLLEEKVEELEKRLAAVESKPSDTSASLALARTEQLIAALNAIANDASTPPNLKHAINARLMQIR